jgi:RNA polymerase sigma-70 factor (ECF subfamily)
VEGPVRDFEEFFQIHYAEVLRAVALAINDRDRAEDVVQEAFARAFRRWRTVSQMDRPVGWVYVVALNAERSRWRRAGQAVDDPGAIDTGADPSGPVVTTIVVRAAIAKLAPRQRAAVVLRFLADLTVPEIARAMGCADGTVKATLHQALRNLRVDLEGSDL